MAEALLCKSSSAADAIVYIEEATSTAKTNSGKYSTYWDSSSGSTSAQSSYITISNISASMSVVYLPQLSIPWDGSSTSSSGTIAIGGFLAAYVSAITMGYIVKANGVTYSGTTQTTLASDTPIIPEFTTPSISASSISVYIYAYLTKKTGANAAGVDFYLRQIPITYTLKNTIIGG